MMPDQKKLYADLSNTDVQYISVDLDENEALPAKFLARERAVAELSRC